MADLSSPQTVASARDLRAPAGPAHPEQVVLLDEDGTPIGVADKHAVHTTDTALHLAFSCHVFDRDGRLLVTRRALDKLTWPGVWTNSFCGHPAPGETVEGAIARRGLDELGIRVTNLALVLPDFRYRAVDASGIVENEICPVYRAITDDVVSPNPSEVSEFEWVDSAALVTAASAAPWAFSPWLVWQLEQLPALPARWLSSTASASAHPSAG